MKSKNILKEEIIINISTKLGLSVNGHGDIDFIDIDERYDTSLYLDPYVIQALPTKFCFEARKCIDTFFQEVFKACQQRNISRIKELLRYASEPNETNLGMKLISDYGKGATSDELTQLFFEFYKIVRNNPHISSNPLALCMYIKNFGKDKMSDLITNIIRQLLYKFTITQCSLWNIPLSKTKHFIGYYWDYSNLSWEELCDYQMEIDGKNFLFVPKEIVRSRYVFNVESYIKQYILKNLQEEHLTKNSDMCITKEYADGSKVLFPPTIKELYKKEVHNTIHKDYALQASISNETSESDFVKDILSRIGAGYGELSDEQLDEIVYRYHKMSA